MKVTVMDTLGAMVAYKPSEVQVVRDIWDKVPDEMKGEFESILISAKTAYDNGVQEAKRNGEKPKSAQLKKDSISSIIEPYLIKIGVSQEREKIIRPKNPRIPGDEKPRVRQKYDLPEIELDGDEVSDIFDTFSSESMSDDLEELPEKLSGDDEQNYSEDLLMGGDVFAEPEGMADEVFGDDDFDFEHLLD